MFLSRRQSRFSKQNVYCAFHQSYQGPEVRGRDSGAEREGSTGPAPEVLLPEEYVGPVSPPHHKSRVCCHLLIQRSPLWKTLDDLSLPCFVVVGNCWEKATFCSSGGANNQAAPAAITIQKGSVSACFPESDLNLVLSYILAAPHLTARQAK